jgi:3-hydroxybutyryl-CoA dehydrogenase
MTDRAHAAGVVGAGTMGAGIVQVALEAGWHVRLNDPLPGAVERGRERILEGLKRRARKLDLDGSAGEAWVDERAGRLSIVTTPEAAADRADLVIEAIVEDLAAKQGLFEVLDGAGPAGTILATNTSALSVSAIAEAAAAHPERVLGLHFFNPAPVMPLVEVVAGRQTERTVMARASAIVASWGKTPVRSADSPGFIVNRVNRPFTIEALRMVEAGEAGIEAIDRAIRAAGFPMGPFELMDLVGLDVNLAAATAVWDGLGRPERLRPSPIQGWLVDAGRLGRKSGEGFYRYGAGQDPVPASLPDDIAPTVRDGNLSAAQIISRIRSAIAAEAIDARDAGVASEVDIDTALCLGAAHPEGPFVWRRRLDPTIAT